MLHFEYKYTINTKEKLCEFLLKTQLLELDENILTYKLCNFYLIYMKADLLYNQLLKYQSYTLINSFMK